MRNVENLVYEITKLLQVGREKKDKENKKDQ
jgi:hypothetical protein